MKTARIEAFSDGVFAVAITILVLELRVPQIGQQLFTEGLLFSELVKIWPKFLSFAMSFAIICIWWVAHHQLFHVVAKSDRGLLWLNSLFLFWLTFLPFPTAMIGDYPSSRTAVIFFGSTMMLVGLSFFAMRYYVSFAARLMVENIPDLERKRGLFRGLISPAAYLLGALTAYWSTSTAILMYCVIPFIYILPGRLEHRHGNDEGS